ncbi:unnamed protein product [Prorocentrum cordatum]|uniref:Uncharacterized protein n=1 Tax=Prorocentrum cordatum TaxID=2364126 RepID=A0ABN9US53_9DINO|nr:unnamed protein product [Polarella glacialis]
MWFHELMSCADNARTGTTLGIPGLSIPRTRAGKTAAQGAFHTRRQPFPVSANDPADNCDTLEELLLNLELQLHVHSWSLCVKVEPHGDSPLSISAAAAKSMPSIPEQGSLAWCMGPAFETLQDCRRELDRIWRQHSPADSMELHQPPLAGRAGGPPEAAEGRGGPGGRWAAAAEARARSLLARAWRLLPARRGAGTSRAPVRRVRPVEPVEPAGPGRAVPRAPREESGAAAAAPRRQSQAGLAGQLQRPPRPRRLRRRRAAGQGARRPGSQPARRRCLRRSRSSRGAEALKGAAAGALRTGLYSPARSGSACGWERAAAAILSEVPLSS